MTARSEAPALSSASVRAGGVAAVRLVLGVVFVVASTLRGLGSGPAVVAAFGGALVLAVIVLGVLAAAFWTQLAARERRQAARYWIERGARPRLFVAEA